MGKIIQVGASATVGNDKVEFEEPVLSPATGF